MVDLENAKRMYDQSKEDYFKAQRSLAAFLDANRAITSATYRIQQEKLENERQLAYLVYSQMAQQVQANKIKVQDDTPVFTIIQPAVEPLYPSKPSKKIILAGILFLAFMGSSIWVLKKDIFDLLFRQDNNSAL